MADGGGEGGREQEGVAVQWRAICMRNNACCLRVEHGHDGVSGAGGRGGSGQEGRGSDRMRRLFLLMNSCAMVIKNLNFTIYLILSLFARKPLC